jgi:hypothetical protein
MNNKLILSYIDTQIALFERRANNPLYHKFARDTNKSCYNSIQQIKKLIIEDANAREKRVHTTDSCGCE